VERIKYEEIEKMSDKELLRRLANRGGAAADSPAGAEQTRDRDIFKAELDYRSSEITKKHNTIMIWLTSVVSILTGMLVYKEFFAQ